MPEEEPQLVSSPPRRRRALALILPTIAVAGLGLWFWLNRGTEHSAQAQEPAAIRSSLHLETFVLNLADVNQRSYLRVGIDLGLNQDAKHAEETVPVSEVRDVILGVLSEAKVDELLTAAGKAKLKQDLLQALQDRMPRLGVQQIFFTEFLIQR